MAEGLQKIWVRVGLSFLAGVVFTTAAVSSCAPLKKKSTEPAKPEAGIAVVIPSEVETPPLRSSNAEKTAPIKSEKETSKSSVAAGSRSTTAAGAASDSSKSAPKKRTEKLTQLSGPPSSAAESSAVNTESSSPAAAVSQPEPPAPKAVAPLAVVKPEPEIPAVAITQPKVPVESQSSSVHSSLGNAPAALPLPEDIRLQAGKALEDATKREEAAALAKKHAGSSSLASASSKPADKKDARARLSDRHEETLPHVSQRQFYLEVAFIALVLFCLIGAMWYRLNSDFGRGPRRRIDR